MDANVEEAPTIARWVRDAREGDRAAFERIVRRFERPVLAHLLGRVPSVEIAEELAQETFVRAYVSLGKLKDPGKFGAWLFGIARNLWKEWAKDRKKRRDPPAPEREEKDEIRQRKANLHRQVFHIVQELPDPYAEVLSMRYFSGNSCQEIADLLGRPLGTVTKQISRGHAMVASRIKALQGYTTLLHFLLPEEDRHAG